jgi:YHS domain-containing protein
LRSETFDDEFLPTPATELKSVTSAVEFSPMHVYFIVTDTDAGDEFEITLTYVDPSSGDDVTETKSLLKSSSVDGKYYYSCTWKMLKMVSI